MARALTQSGWLPQFRVFNSLHQAGLAAEDDSHAWTRRPPPQPTRRRTRALAIWLAPTRPGALCLSHSLPPPHLQKKVFFSFSLFFFFRSCFYSLRRQPHLA